MSAPVLAGIGKLQKTVELGSAEGLALSFVAGLGAQDAPLLEEWLNEQPLNKMAFQRALSSRLVVAEIAATPAIDALTGSETSKGLLLANQEAMHGLVDGQISFVRAEDMTQNFYFPHGILSGPMYSGSEVAYGIPKPSFLRAAESSNVVTIKGDVFAQPPLTLVFALGLATDGQRRTQAVSISWDEEVPCTETCMLFVEFDPVAETITSGTEPVSDGPHYARTAPGSPATYDYWFDIDNNVLKQWRTVYVDGEPSGEDWVVKHRVILGEIGLGQDGNVYTMKSYWPNKMLADMEAAHYTNGENPWVHYDGVSFLSGGTYIAAQADQWVNEPAVVDAVVKNFTALTAIANSPISMDAVVNSSAFNTALNDYLAVDFSTIWANNPDVMDVVASSDMAVNTIANDATSRGIIESDPALLVKIMTTLAGLTPTNYANIDAVANDATAMTAIASNQTLMDFMMVSDPVSDAFAVSNRATNAIGKSTLARNTVGTSGAVFDKINASDNGMAGYLSGAANRGHTTLSSLASNDTTMEAIATTQAALDIGSSSSLATTVIAADASNYGIGKYIAGLAGLNPGSYADMNAVAASSVAMNVVAASSAAMNTVVASSVAMDAVAASSVAMDAVIASPVGLGAVLNNTVFWNSPYAVNFYDTYRVANSYFSTVTSQNSISWTGPSIGDSIQRRVFSFDIDLSALNTFNYSFSGATSEAFNSLWVHLDGSEYFAATQGSRQIDVSTKSGVHTISVHLKNWNGRDYEFSNLRGT